MRTLLLLIAFACTILVNAQVSVHNSELQLSGPITFKGKTATLTQESEPFLKEVKDYLDAKKYITAMRIEGHVAGYDENQKLSEERAIAVCKWLIAHGISCTRILAVGFGDSKPSGPDNSANTRIVIANAALNNRPIGGMPLDGGGKVAGDLCN